MKYMGSKARFAKELLPIILENRGSKPYVEPFVGGANIIQYVDGDRLGADTNECLIAMWSGLIDGSLTPRKVTRQEYMEAKSSPNMAWRGWVGFNCSYSGKFFGGYAGETPTKLGTIRDYQAEAIRNIEKQLRLLSGCKFEKKSYDELNLSEPSVVYCDPPYAGTTEYKDKFSHSAFWDWCRSRSMEGHSVFVSEYAAPHDFDCVWSKEVGSSLSANGKIGGRKSSIERLFTPPKT